MDESLLSRRDAQGLAVGAEAQIGLEYSRALEMLGLTLSRSPGKAQRAWNGAGGGPHAQLCHHLGLVSPL